MEKGESVKMHSTVPESKKPNQQGNWDEEENDECIGKNDCWEADSISYHSKHLADTNFTLLLFEIITSHVFFSVMKHVQRGA